MLPEPRLCFVHDADDAFEPLQALREAAREDPTRLFVPVTPIADNLRILSSDILAALGKDANLHGSGRRGTEMWLRALLWLQVSDVEEIYVSRAHLLKPWLLEHLIGAACLAQVRLVLIFGTAALRRSQEEVLADWPFQAVTMAQLVKRKPRGPRTRRRKRETEPTKRLPAVPMDNFTSFRAAARELLSEEDFAAVDREFVGAVKRTASYISRCGDLTEAGLCQHLRELIADSDWMPEILTRLRGGEVAAFHGGYLVRVNLDVLAATRTPRPRLDSETLAIIEQYDAPRLTALMVLTIATGLELAALQPITLADVAGDGSRIRIGERIYELDARSGALVEALVRERLASFADDSDPLFIFTPGTGRTHGPQLPWTRRGMSDALKRVERDSNLMLTTHLVDAGQRDPVAWARRRGLSLQRM